MKLEVQAFVEVIKEELEVGLSAVGKVLITGWTVNHVLCRNNTGYNMATQVAANNTRKRTNNNKACCVEWMVDEYWTVDNSFASI